MILVYIASPYNLGDKTYNVLRQIKASHNLLKEGYNTYLPLSRHFEHILLPKDESLWLQCDIDMLLRCDCLLRLEGESKGADLEVCFAEKHNIKCFFDYEALFNFYKDKK